MHISYDKYIRLRSKAFNMINEIYLHFFITIIDSVILAFMYRVHTIKRDNQVYSLKRVLGKLC